MRLRLLAVLTIAAITAPALRAQSERASGIVRGRVVDSLTLAPIPGATVEISPTQLRQITDSSGRFAFASVPSGAQIILVRRLGYLAGREELAIGRDTIEHQLTLRRLPIELRQVVISGRPVTFPRFFEDAYARAARGRGVFFTREDIEEWNTTDYQSLFNRIPSVSANDRGVTFNRCQAGLVRAFDPREKPKVQVYVDGSRMALDADDFHGIYAALSSVKPAKIQLMEVYPNLSSIPAEFLADACAVVVIWTKRD